MTWITVKSNTVWIRPDHVSAIAGNGLKGAKGSTIHLIGGQDIQTEYPVTQLQAIIFGDK